MPRTSHYGETGVAPHFQHLLECVLPILIPITACSVDRIPCLQVLLVAAATALYMVDVHSQSAIVHIASALVDGLSNCLAGWGLLLLVVDQLFPCSVKVCHALARHCCHFLHWCLVPGCVQAIHPQTGVTLP